MAKPKQIFPDVLYVVREEEGDEHWFVTHEDIEDFDHGTVVATYDISSQHTVRVIRELR